MIIPKPLQLLILLLSLPLLTLEPTKESRSVGGLGTEIALDWAGDVFGNVTVEGQILPSPEYLADDLQYFPPDESFRLDRDDSGESPDE